MSTSSNSNKETSTVVSTITGIGVFMVTAILSQWVQHKLRNDVDRSDDCGNCCQRHCNGDDDNIQNELRQLYANRRMHDRLSYEDLSKVVEQQSSQRLTSEHSPPSLSTRHGQNRPLGFPTQRQSSANDDEDDDDDDDNDRSSSVHHEIVNDSSPHMLSWSLGFPDSGPDYHRKKDDVNNNADFMSISVEERGVVGAGQLRNPEMTEWQLHLQQRKSTSQLHRLGNRHGTPYTSSSPSERDTRMDQSSVISSSPLYCMNDDNHDSKSISSITNVRSHNNIKKKKNKTGRDNDHQVELQHPNAHFDFHPKNRNWRHFEHYSEYDYKRRSVQHRNRQQQEQQQQSSAAPIVHKQDTSTPLDSTDNLAKDVSGNANNDIDEGKLDDGDDEDTDDENDAQSISSSSASSEEQFVWTKHKHRSSVFHYSQRHEGRVGNTNKKEGTYLGEDVERSSNDVKPNHHTMPSATAVRDQVGHSTMGTMKPLTIVRRMLSLGSGEDELRKSNPSYTSTSSFSRTAPTATSAPATSTTSMLSVHSRKLRAEYNARIMPEKLIMVRHGQSMGNVNEVLYSTTPDNAMPLTDLGWEQARAAGKILKEKMLARGGSVHFIVSPYVRTVETFHGIVSAWCDPDEDESISNIEDRDARVKAWYERLMELGLTWNEDSRLREQDFGNYQNPEIIKQAKEERQRFGAFYYRFPNGESASDVFDRVSTFLDSLWRSFEMNKSQNYVLVTHGIVLRVLLTRYFRYTIDQFNTLANPRNCELVVLGHGGDGKLDMEGRCALELDIDPNTGKKRICGYKFHKRLRILPKSSIRKVMARISASDK